MKSLSLTKPLVIMLVGVPGSGKSFFARQFAEMFQAPLISYDRLRYHLAPQGAYDKEREETIVGLALDQAREMAKTQKTFVIDGGMNNRATRSELEKIAHAAGYGALIIWTQIDTATARARSQRRLSTREGDEYARPMTPAVYEQYSKELTNPSVREAHIVISGKHTFATQARVVLKRLVETQDRVMTRSAGDGSRVAMRPVTATPRGPRSISISG